MKKSYSYIVDVTDKAKLLELIHDTLMFRCDDPHVTHVLISENKTQALIIYHKADE